MSTFFISLSLSSFILIVLVVNEVGISIKHLPCHDVSFLFRNVRQLITCESGKEDKQFDNCNYEYCMCASAELLSQWCSIISNGHTHKKKRQQQQQQQQNNKHRMINGRCFLAPNVSHYNPIQHHLSFVWSISSIPLSITCGVRHRFSIC